MEVVTLESVLHRDQRTTKNRTDTMIDRGAAEGFSHSFYNPYPSNNNNINNMSRKFDSVRTLHKSSGLKKSSTFWKNEHLRKSIRKLRHAVVVLTFLVLFTFPSSSSAPSMEKVNPSRLKKLEERLKSSPPAWAKSSSSSTDGVATTVEHLVNVTPIKNELGTLVGSASQLISLYLDSDLGAKLNGGSGTISPHLPKGPKAADNYKTVNEFLVSLFNDMQVYAVILEQVVWDLNDSYGLYALQFKKCKDVIDLLQLEIKDQIIYTKYQEEVQPFSRDVMPFEQRCLDHSGTDTRNFFIAKAYHNYLEDALNVIDSFDQEKVH